MPLIVVTAFVVAVSKGSVLVRGIDLKTDDRSLISRSKSSKSRWKEAALMSVIRSVLPLYRVSMDVKPVSWQPAKKIYRHWLRSTKSRNCSTLSEALADEQKRRLGGRGACFTPNFKVAALLLVGRIDKVKQLLGSVKRSAERSDRPGVITKQPDTSKNSG